MKYVNFDPKGETMNGVNRSTVVLGVMVVLLAVGWWQREVSLAQEQEKLVQSKTLNRAEAGLKDFEWQGKPTGQVGIYFAGNTPTSREFVTGRFVLRPGLEPHPIHQHPEEEILIVTAGEGEISCDGKITKVSAGSVMYTAPNVPHGIRNTGKDVLEFYFVKWIGRK